MKNSYNYYTLALALILSVFFTKTTAQVITINTSLTDDHQEIDGTNLAMIPPPNFEQTDLFTGLTLESKTASILVVSMPTAFEMLASGFTQENLDRNQIKIISKDSMVFNGKDGFLLKLKQPAQGRTFYKWLLAFGIDDKTYLINGIYPEEFEDELGDIIKQAILSSFLIEEKVVDPLNAVDYQINLDDNWLKFASGIENSTLIFTVDGKLPPQTDDKTLFIVGKSIGKAFVNDPLEFSKERLKEMPVEVEEIDKKNIHKVEFGGLSGYEIIAYGQSQEKKNKELVYQVILFKEDIYYILVGTSNMNFEENLMKFRSSAQSFTLK